MDFLHYYETVSSQQINQAKSSFYMWKFDSASSQMFFKLVTSFQQKNFYLFILFVWCTWDVSRFGTLMI